MATSGPPDRGSDKDLVAICNHGDEREAARAFEALYRRHKDYVLRIALRYVDDNDAALDALQETFAYVLKKFPPAGEGLTLTARFTSFLYPVAKNCAISLTRKSQRFPAADVRPDDLPAARAPEGSDVSGAIRDLPDERREVIMLRFVDDLSLKEIADVLKIPLGTVKSRLHLAIKQLRNAPGTKKFFDP